MSFSFIPIRPVYLLELREPRPAKHYWHDIDTSVIMMQFVKYLFFDSEGEASRFKLVPAFVMVVLFLSFQASIVYVLLSTMFES